MNKNPSCLRYVGDEILPSYMGIIKTMIRVHINNQYQWNVIRVVDCVVRICGRKDDDFCGGPEVKCIEKCMV